MFVEGIYDLLIELKQYPYLEARREYVHTMTVTDVTEYLSTIVADEPITVERLKHKMSVIGSMGYGEDGGFPILSEGDILEGYVATSEVTFGLEQLEKTLAPSMDETEINDIPCYFNRLGREMTCNMNPFQNDDIKTPIRNLLSAEVDHENIESPVTASSKRQALNNFSQYIDHVSEFLKKKLSKLVITSFNHFRHLSQSIKTLP